MEWAKRANFDTEKLFVRTNEEFWEQHYNNDSIMQRINVISDEVPTNVCSRLFCVASHLSLIC